MPPKERGKTIAVGKAARLASSHVRPACGRKMRPHGPKQLGQDCFTRQAQIGRCARDADIKKPEEQAGNAFGQAVDADKKDGLELHSLDVLHIEDTHLARVTYDEAPFVTHDRDVAFTQSGTRSGKQRIDLVVTIDEDGDGWQPTDTSLHFVNPLCEPLCECVSGEIFPVQWPGVRLLVSARRIGFCSRNGIEEQRERIGQFAKPLALAVSDPNPADVDIDPCGAVQPLNSDSS